MTTFILVRHGLSFANDGHFFAGNIDTPLVETGRKQALKTAQYIIDNYKIDIAYASDLSRAFNTGKCIAQLAGVEIITDKNLREIQAGEWEGVAFDEIKTRFANDYNVWINDIGNARCTGGESVRELYNRVVTTLTKIAEKHDSQTVLIATHATPIRAMQCFVQQGGNIDNMNQIPWVSNASVSTLVYDNGSWHFKTVNFDSHLSDLKTVLPKGDV